MRAIKGYRETCWALCLGRRAKLPAEGLIPMKITFHPPDRRPRDDDNMIASFKRGRDGMAHAFGVDDGRFRPTYHFAEPIKGGQVVVRIAG